MVDNITTRETDIYVCPDGNKHHHFWNSLACVSMCVYTKECGKINIDFMFSWHHSLLVQAFIVLLGPLESDLFS